MYVCGWDTLNVGTRTVHRGDPVPEAETWAENIKRANVRLGCIVETKKGAGPGGPVSVAVSPAAQAAAGGTTPPSPPAPAPPPEEPVRNPEHEPREPRPIKAKGGGRR